MGDGPSNLATGGLTTFGVNDNAQRYEPTELQPRVPKQTRVKPGLGNE